MLLSDGVWLCAVPKYAVQEGVEHALFTYGHGLCFAVKLYCGRRNNVLSVFLAAIQQLEHIM